MFTKAIQAEKIWVVTVQTPTLRHSNPNGFFHGQLSSLESFPLMLKDDFKSVDSDSKMYQKMAQNIENGENMPKTSKMWFQATFFKNLKDARCNGAYNMSSLESFPLVLNYDFVGVDSWLIRKKTHPLTRSVGQPIVWDKQDYRNSITFGMSDMILRGRGQV